MLSSILLSPSAETKHIMLKKKPTKKRITAAAIEATALAQQGAGIIILMSEERHAMDRAVDELIASNPGNRREAVDKILALRAARMS